MAFCFIGSYPLHCFTNKAVDFDDVDVLTDDIATAKQYIAKEYQFDPSIKFDYHLAKDEMLEFLRKTPTFPTLNSLLTLKLSHLQWDVLWKKHAEQAVLLMSSYGCTPDISLFHSFSRYWKKHHGDNKKRITLNKENAEFFDNGVAYKFVHDDLHEAVKHKKHPMYWYIKEDKNSAKTSDSLLDKLSPQDKILLCREEMYVVALERFIIPNNFTCDPVVACRRALHKLCTSMTKGLFCQTILFNLHHLWNPDLDFIYRFNRAYFNNQLTLAQG